MMKFETVCASLILGCAGIATHEANAQTATPMFTTLAMFTSDDGPPPTSLIEGSDGSFYFIGVAGHSRGLNAVFRVTRSGKVETVRRLKYKDGQDLSGIVMASDGNLYGTFENDARDNLNACGGVFKLTASGKLTTLHMFAGGNEGSTPSTGLIQARDGNFYGTTKRGGEGHPGLGTIFKVTPAGQLTTLHSFTGRGDGWSPADNLIEGGDGNLYGTTPFSAGAGGTIYKLSPSGQKTTLYQFEKKDGALSKLIQGHDGNLYGTTSMGTVHNGTIFRITVAGELTTLYVFSPGVTPNSGLVEGKDGNLFGTTDPSGTLVPAAIYRLDASGQLTILHRFIGTDGTFPNGLVLATDGDLYGMTERVIFRLILEQPNK
jgi:uncharacterized repeat protein (TIGR03803 family)